MRCCQGASAAFVPAGLRGLAFPFAYASDPPKWSSPGSEFHLHPHYRAQLPLEATLLKTQAGLDDFVTEKYHDQIAAILAEWSAGLLGFPQDVRAVEKSLAPSFSGCSFRPVEANVVRHGPAVEVRQKQIRARAGPREGRISRGVAVRHGFFFGARHRRISGDQY